MKHIKKLSSLIAAAFVLFLMQGCVKENKQTFTDFSQVSDLVILQNSGLANFGASNVNVDATSTDTLTLDVYAALASINTSSSDVTVTLAVDNSKVAAYNTANGTKFLPMTTDMFKLLNNTITIKAGQHYAKTAVKIFQTKFDPTKSYLLPVTITDASGKALSSNQNTIFFNVIGNILAGPYKWDFTRYNNNNGSGTPHSLSFTAHTTNFVAASPTMVRVSTGYYTGPRYELSFNQDASGNPTNFQLKFNDEDIKGINDAGVTIADGPYIIKADPVKKEFIFQFVASTASGPRYIIDRYYQ